MAEDINRDNESPDDKECARRWKDMSIEGTFLVRGGDQQFYDFDNYYEARDFFNSLEPPAYVYEIQLVDEDDNECTVRIEEGDDGPFWSICSDMLDDIG